MIDGDSDVMNQADAILKYLVHKYPDANLGDNDTLQDAYEVDCWLAFLTGDFHPAFFPYFVPNRYSTDDSVRVAWALPNHAQKSVKEASYKLIDRVYKHLNAHLEGKAHIVGNRRTIADAYAFPMLRWGNNLPKPLSDYPNLNRFYQHLREDVGVQQAMKQQGIQ
ncbi:MAG: glutathione S-transferase family protein [Chroococcidiopsidaceae cyanobacterium CP_BM_ER_R8_30]|nr:glutathione S-transferase family protein [Chroococcidiopsidaceae cyanobacterium CP_BM_ER_R8_30]